MTVITEEKEPGTRIIEGLAPHCMVLMHARMKMNQQHCLRQQLAYRSLFPPAVCRLQLLPFWRLNWWKVYMWTLAKQILSSQRSVDCVEIIIFQK